MKKLLITAMAAVSVGLCAKAEDASTFTGNGTSFDDSTLNPGDSFTFSSDYWTVTDNSEDLFKIIEVAYPDGVEKKHWDWATSGEKALSIDTANPILRNVNQQSDTDNSYPAQAVTTPVFFDSVVQFTATDVAPSLEGNTTDKLMVWLYATPEGTEGRLFGEDDAITNLVITAGYYDGDGNRSYTNYLTNVAIQPDTWHRLTIKAINDIGIHNLPTPGFEVYVDGNKNPVSGKCDYDGENPTLVTKFPSLIARNNSGVNYLQGVAFDGKGAVDDIVFTTENPFAVVSYTVKTTINDIDGAAYTKQYSIDGGSQYTVFAANGSSPFVENLLIPQSVENIKFKFLVYHSYKVEGATKTTETVDYDGERYIYWEKQIAVSSISFKDNVGEITLNVVLGEEVTYPTVKPNGDSATQETLSASAAAAIEVALAGVETMPDALTVIVNEKEYFGDEAVAKINEVVEMFEAAEEGATLKFFNDEGEMIVSFKAKNPFMETETAEATDYEAMVGESAATVTSKYTVNKETVDLTPGVGGENEAVTFKLVIKPVGSTGSDTGSEEQN